MICLRSMVATLIALSLAIVPVGASAYAAGMASIAASQASDCSPCPMTHAPDAAVGMAVNPMSSDCHDLDGKAGSMTPSACAMFCSGVPALPSRTPVIAVADHVELLRPRIELTLAGHIDPPEPYPPKR
jgi:hypothetical protein